MTIRLEHSLLQIIKEITKESGISINKKCLYHIREHHKRTHKRKRKYRQNAKNRKIHIIHRRTMVWRRKQWWKNRKHQRRQIPTSHNPIIV